MKERGKNNLTGVTGEYYVCAELGKRGILALTTPKNNPLYDVVAISGDAKRTIAIQVKTMSLGNKQGWKLGKDICVRKNNNNLYVVLVNLKQDVEFYIYKYDDLSKRVEEDFDKYMSTPKRDGNAKKDGGFRWHDFKNFIKKDHKRKNKWELLGFNLKKQIQTFVSQISHK